MRARPITHYHAYQKILNAYNGYLRVPDPQHRGSPCHFSRKRNTSVTNNIRVFSYYKYVIITSFYIFYASSVALAILLLKKPSN